jgi:aminopeptidase N
MISKSRHIRGFLFFLLLMGILSCTEKDAGLLEKGISKELAVFRKSHISNVSYNLSFRVPDNSEEGIDGRLALKFEFIDEITDLILDFNASPDLIHEIKIADQIVKADIKNEHIVIPSKYLGKTNTIEFDFTAGSLSLNRHDDYLFTLFVPDRASTCFPLMDQPDIKATYKLELNIPKHWTAVANGIERKVLNEGDRRTFQFEETQPISSYLFAFAAGEFDIVERTMAGRKIRMIHRETDSVRLAENIEEIFQQHSRAIDWLEKYTGIPYPFPKFDFVLIPSFQYGGMEHPGAVFYKASSLLLSESSTLNQQMGRARLIAHETAHMWFGNLVTMRWFDDVWLKEVFANFMASKIIDPQFPNINHDLQFLMGHYPTAYDVDRTDGTHPISQQLDNLKNAGSLYGSIIYQKAPIVMRMLEQKIGDSIFQEGLKIYLNNNRYSNASWDDLIGIMEQQSGMNLDMWNQRWVKTSGMPTIMYRLRENKNNDHLNSFQLVSQSSKNDYWPQQVTVAFEKGDTIQLVPVNIDAYSVKMKTDSIYYPHHLFTNYGGLGYGYFTMGPVSMEYYLANIKKVKSSVARGSLWINYYEQVLRGQLKPELLMEAILKQLPIEKEALIIEYLNTRVSTLFWKIFTPEQRLKYASKIEGILLNMAINTTSTELKSSFFKTFYDVTITQHSIDLIKNIWDDKVVVEGLVLSEEDHISLAYELAVRQVDSTSYILDYQIEKVKNKDRKERMKWVIKALNPDPQERDAFFESLKNEENRENEEWVLEAMNYLNHPLRQPQSDKYIRPGLELLEEIKTTGDIFFPKRWLDALLSGHQSAEAANEVRQFLYKHNKYPADLKNKILQTSDMLFRSVQIQAENDSISIE